MAYFRDINFFSPTKKSEVIDAEAVRQEMAMLFNTKPGERLFEPDYGIGLENHLFELISFSSANELYFEIQRKVERYVGSVVINKSRSEVIPDIDNGRYVLDLFFDIKGTGNGEYQMTKSFTNR